LNSTRPAKPRGPAASAVLTQLGLSRVGYRGRLRVVARASKEVDSVSPSAAEEIAPKVRAQRSQTPRALGLGRLSPRALAQLKEWLAPHQIEWTGKAFRVAIEVQVLEELRDRDPLSIRAIKKTLRGVATASELDATLRSLVQGGQVAVVFSGGELQLTTALEDRLTPTEVQELTDLVGTLQKSLRALKSRKQPRPGLRRSEVQALLGRELGGPSAGGQDPDQVVLDEVRRLAGGPIRMAFVPELSVGLRSVLRPAAIQEVLLRLASDGRLELRPESGVGLLSEAEASLCPIAPDGRPLSYVRPI
jgi:hypothetical protein